MKLDRTEHTYNKVSRQTGVWDRWVDSHSLSPSTTQHLKRLFTQTSTTTFISKHPLIHIKLIFWQDKRDLSLWPPPLVCFPSLMVTAVLLPLVHLRSSPAYPPLRPSTCRTPAARFGRTHGNCHLSDALDNRKISTESLFSNFKRESGKPWKADRTSPTKNPSPSLVKVTFLRSSKTNCLQYRDRFVLREEWCR